MPDRMPDSIVLASASPFRKALLRNAGLVFDIQPARLDERAIEAPFARTGATPEDIALVLAEAKALDVSERRPDALVIGCDQTLSLGDEVLHKPIDMEGARRRLRALAGRTHELNSAVVLSRGGKTLWRHVSVARMTMRPLDPAFVGRYLAMAGAAALSSVGAYQVEGPGIQLFDRIDGDYFSIVGLPLLPLLSALRGMGAING